MIRNAVVAGQFYPKTEASLKKMLSTLIPHAREKESAKGIIMPHAGYIYSGSVAGETISKAHIEQTAIILGTNHTGAGETFSIMTKGSWATPLGNVKIDIEIAESILRCSSMLKEDMLAHMYEHSIEVQLPFLQYLRSDIKIVPLVISYADLEEYKTLGREIAEGFKKVGRSALFIASSDMTHYESKEEAEKKDALAINAILDLDEEKLFSVVEEHNISMCGIAPACTLISICKNIGAEKATLIKYQTSGDVSGDYSSVVGYAGFLIC